VYSSRYVSDRFLPDKAIDLVDEAASALRLGQESKPDELEALEREIMTLQIELESLKNEADVFSVERRQNVEQELRDKRQEAKELTSIWQAGAYSAQCFYDPTPLMGVLRTNTSRKDQGYEATARRSEIPTRSSTTTRPIRGC